MGGTKRIDVWITWSNDGNCVKVIFYNILYFDKVTTTSVQHVSIFILNGLIALAQGGHTLAKMKFPVFSLSFPCVTEIFPVLFLCKNYN